jgi:precorrin-6x reductase
MIKVLVFGGTSEEHELIRALSRYPAALTLCVASEYGAALLKAESDKLSVRTGRMDAGQITALIQNEGFSTVVDTTHPYAVEVTQNIRKAATDTGIPYLRLLRESSRLDGARIVSSAEEAAEMLKDRPGNVLLTTGSKELGAYTGVQDYQDRLYARVLPTVASIEACLSQGFKSSHIIAMHGPFSKELNMTIMRQFDIKTLVTKDGGKPGGFSEKLEAVRELGAELIVIGRPAEEADGFPLVEIVGRIAMLLEDRE